MHISLRAVLCLPFLALAACEDMSATGGSDLPKLVITFVLAAGVGLGVTVGIAKLIM